MTGTVNLTIGQRYKVIATPNSGMTCKSIVITTGEVEGFEVKNDVGTGYFTMTSEITKVNATFERKGGEDQEVNIGGETSNGTVEVEEA